jgi:tRNA threonylcarbamoyladenosine biosynthesis protein TsaE
MKIIVTKNFLETQKVAEKLIKKLKPGDVLTLKGNLGSGKTCFAQGLAKALGIKKIITSPTFVLLKIYPVRCKITPVKFSKVGVKQLNTVNINIKKLYHFDLYRLNNEKELLALGFEEILEKKDGIIVLEWPERTQKILPKKRININFKFIDENTRKIKIENLIN